jgi:hypothetical protein
LGDFAFTFLPEVFLLRLTVRDITVQEADIVQFPVELQIQFQAALSNK